MIPALLVALRPRQWIKNLLVFAAPLFAFVTDPGELLRVVGAFVSFCAVSSAVRIIFSFTFTHMNCTASTAGKKKL